MTNLEGLNFHHIGVTCRAPAVEKESAILQTLGYAIEGKRFTDQRLGIDGLFLHHESGMLPRIELCAPLDDTSPIVYWLQRGIKMYHLGFQTPRFDESIDRLRSSRAKLVFEPTPAVAFDYRRVAFLMLPNMLLIELIEQSAQSPEPEAKKKSDEG